jgi:hypothetical protein
MRRLEVRDIELGGESVSVGMERGILRVTGAGHLRVEQQAREPLTRG